MPPIPSPPTPTPLGRTPSALSVFGQRLVGHGSVYAIAGAFGFFMILVQVVVLTRILEFGEYGRIAILLLFAHIVGLLCGLALTTGTIIAAFGGGDEEEMVDEERPQKAMTDNRGVLISGLLMTLVNATLLTVLVSMLASPLAELLTGGPEGKAAVIWAAAYGATGPTWRILTAIPRFERRPGTYLAMSMANNVLAVAVSALFAALGHGITGVMAGMALSRVPMIAVGLVISRHRFRRTFKRAHVHAIYRRGWPFAGLILCFFVARNAEFFILSHYVGHGASRSGAGPGTYQVAARLALIPGFAMSATLMAWGPLARGPLKAAMQKQGRMGPARSRVVTYYIMLATWIVVTGAVLGDVLVRIAPAQYASAAKVLPLLLLAGGLHALLILIFRLAMPKGGLKRLRRWAIVSAILIIGASLLVIPKHGALGAAIVNAVVPAIGVVWIVWATSKNRNPIPWSRRQIVGIVLVAATCIAGGKFADLLVPEDQRLPIDLALIVAFPVLLVMTSVLPFPHARQLLRLVRPSLGQRVDRADLRDRLRLLPVEDFELVEALVRRSESPGVAAERRGISEAEVLGRLVAVLREVSRTGKPAAVDARMGRLLIVRTAQTKQDVKGFQLSQNPDVDPLELDRLTQAVAEIRRMRKRAWRGARVGAVVAGDDDAVAPVPAPAGAPASDPTRQDPARA